MRVQCPTRAYSTYCKFGLTFFKCCIFLRGSFLLYSKHSLHASVEYTAALPRNRAYYEFSIHNCPTLIKLAFDIIYIYPHKRNKNQTLFKRDISWYVLTDILKQTY